MTVRTTDQEQRRAVQGTLAALEPAELEALARIATMAARSLRAEFGAVTTVDRALVHVVAAHGFDHRALPRDQFFCSTTVRSDRVFTVLDARMDPRFEQLGVVVGEPYLRFYAGVPLRAGNGAIVGALSAFDGRPRKNFGDDERHMLAALAAQAGQILSRIDAAPPGLTTTLPRTPIGGAEAVLQDGRAPLWTPVNGVADSTPFGVADDATPFWARGRHDDGPPVADATDVSAALAAELVANPELLQRIIDSNPNPVFIKNADDVFVMANAAGAALFGRTADQLIGLREGDLDSDPDNASISGTFERVTTDVHVAVTGTEPREELFVDSEGAERWFQVGRRCLEPSSTGARYILTIATEITELKAVERRESDRLALTRVVSGSEPLTAVLEKVAAFVERHIGGALCFVWTRRGQEVRVSFTDAVPLGLAAQVRTRPCPPTKIPQNVGDKRHRPIYADRLDDAPAAAPYTGQAETAGLRELVSYPICSASGAVIGVLDVLTPRSITDGRDGRDVVSAATDLAAIAIEQRHRQSMLSYQARYDSLTQLPNRYALEGLLNRAIAHGKRHDHMAGLLYIDLDRFQHVNDTLGHAVGDALLREVAARFEGCLRSTDSLARLGGDEFGAVLMEVADTAGATRVAQKLMDALKRPFDIAGFSLVVTTTVGISMYPHDGDDAATLMRNADAALHKAKQSGRDTFRFFARDFHDSALERLELETALREAIAQRDLRLYLQPQLDVRTGRTVGFEALARWEHPRLGAISPARFIALAEETRMIADIGQWALEEACRAVRHWIERDGGPIRVGVNVSPSQLTAPEFVEKVRRTLELFGVPPRMLELEITENAMVHDVDTVVPRLAALRDLGVSIAIDDFGTGYSNLGYLQRLPIDRVKIDKEFVGRIEDSPSGGKSGARLVRAIIDIAHTFGLEVIAEGVETTDQLVFLRNAGCEVAQGYLYHAPMPAEEAMDVILDG